MTNKYHLELDDLKIQTGWEAIEIDDRGVMVWIGGDDTFEVINRIHEELGQEPPYEDVRGADFLFPAKDTGQGSNRGDML